MTPTQDLQPLQLRVRVDWVLSERQAGLWVPIHRFHNLVTNFGLTALAQAPGGSYAPPIYLVINTAATTVSLGANPGDPTVQLAADLAGGHWAGDCDLLSKVFRPALHLHPHWTSGERTSLE